MSFLSKIASWFVGNDEEGGGVSVQEAVKPETSEPEVPADSTVATPESAATEEPGSWWWETPVPVPEASPEFEEIDTETIFSGVAFKLAKGDIALIEIPDNVVDIIKLLEKEEFNYDEVSENIERSPVLVGEFLKAANSAQFSRGTKISNIKVILPRLGRNTVKSILYLSTSKLSLPNHELFSAVAAQVVEHCMVVGRIAEYLSERYYQDSSKAFLAGLLHDIGKVAIIKEISENMTLPDDLNVGFSESLFRNVFPELHEGAGSLICTHWQLDDEVTNAVQHHHDEAFASEDEDGNPRDLELAALINLSDTAARMLGFGTPIGHVDLFSLPAAQALHVEKDPDTCRFFQGIMDLFEVVEAPEAN